MQGPSYITRHSPFSHTIDPLQTLGSPSGVQAHPRTPGLPVGGFDGLKQSSLLLLPHENASPTKPENAMIKFLLMDTRLAVASVHVDGSIAFM
jgi:hypothetical protein